MAKLISKCSAFTNGKTQGQGSRVGDDEARGEANSRLTFSKVTLFGDGSGFATVIRQGKTVKLQWNAEDQPLNITQLEGHP